MNQILRIAHFITIFILLSVYNSCGQQKDDYTNKIDSLILTNAVRPFNGVILVAQNGKTTYSKAYGYSSFDKKIPLNIDGQFVILSNSKQITAALVLKEVEKGRVHLHAAIRKYLPDIPQPWADSVTVHSLLNHTSGIIDLNKPLVFKAGTQFRYSDMNYILLGKIIERTSKKSYETLANELFDKCGMKDTFFPNANNQQHVVNGYQYLQDKTRKEIKGIVIPQERIPAAGIVTTAKDLSAWNDQLHNGKILKKETYKLMISYSIVSQHNVFGEKAIGYGYGIRVNDRGSLKEFGHTGIVPEQGFTSVNLYYPDTKTSVIVLENQAFDDFAISYYFETAIRQIIRQSNLTKLNYR